jgi:hypothetical protein
MGHVETKVYSRKTFEVEAVQVTKENINDVADWCDGEIRLTGDNVPFIKVKVHRPLTTRQTRAFVGDWILFAGRGFKVYTSKAFFSSFIPFDW